MANKGYVVNGTREMVEVGAEALAALERFVDGFGDYTVEVAEFRVYENMPVEAVLFDGVTFTTYAWTRMTWVEA